MRSPWSPDGNGTFPGIDCLNRLWPWRVGFVAICLWIGSPAVAAQPKEWSAELRTEHTVLFGGGTSQVEIIFRNRSSTSSSLRVGSRWLRTVGNIAAPLPDTATWRTIRADAGVSLVETISLRVPSVRTPATHLLQCHDAAGRVLGIFPVSIIPAGLFAVTTGEAQGHSDNSTLEGQRESITPGTELHGLNRFRWIRPQATESEKESAKAYASAGGIVLELAGAAARCGWVRTLDCGLWISLPLSEPAQLTNDAALQLSLFQAMEGWHQGIRSLDCDKEP